MSRLPLEMADILCQAGKQFLEKRRRWLTWQHVRVLRAIQNCRTAVLGGHKDRCAQCGHRAISLTRVLWGVIRYGE